MDTIKDSGTGNEIYECLGFAVEPKTDCPHLTEEMI